MPELPEVETVVRDLRADGLVGLAVRDVVLRWPGVLGGAEASELTNGVRGRRVLDVTRRAKFIHVVLGGNASLLIHLRMTGRLVLSGRAAAPLPHERARLALSDGRALVFCDPRKFGRWVFTADPAAHLARLGPEPLSGALTPRQFSGQLQRRRRLLKPLLLDQAFLAGVGNIYADESLWAARLHPLRMSCSLTPGEGARLLRCVRRVLRQAIRLGGTTLGGGEGNFRGPRGQGRNQERLSVYGRRGEPCPRCGGAIRRLVVGQRGTHVCERCQPPPRTRQECREEERL